MVKLHVKKGDESIFLYETTVQTPIQELIPKLVKLHNGILKVQRLCQGKQSSIKSLKWARKFESSLAAHSLE